MTSKAIWLSGAADDYYLRNLNDFGQGNDLVIPLIKKLNFRGGVALEVGCANGWRLHKLAEEYGFTVAGIDPSLKAITAARLRELPGLGFLIGTADDLSAFADDAFSLVIMGFVLYFCEPELWFKIVAEVDRVLTDKGLLIIHDFVSPRAAKVEKWADKASDLEKQAPTYLYDYKHLWLGHPWYRKIIENVGFRHMGETFMFECATVLLKDKSAIIGSSPDEKFAIR